MRKLTVLIDGDSETLDLPEPFSLDKHILVKKATIFWEYHNVGKNETHYYTIKKVGTVISSLVSLDEGYWTLKDIANKLSTKGATLTESSIDGKCTISMGK